MTDIRSKLESILSTGWANPVRKIIVHSNRIEYQREHSGWQTEYSGYSDFTGTIDLNHSGFQKVHELTILTSNVSTSGYSYNTRIINDSYSYGGGYSGSTPSHYKNWSEWREDSRLNESEKRILRNFDEDIGGSAGNLYELDGVNGLKKILEKIVYCENVARSESQIRYNFSGQIKKFDLFNPHFDEAFDCAVVIKDNDVWVIAYKPLRGMSNGQSRDLIVEKVYSCYSEWEADSKSSEVYNKLRYGSHPILALATPYRINTNWIKLSDIIRSPYVQTETLSSQALDYPDQHLLPFDIVKKEIRGWPGLYHFAIYLGNGRVGQILWTDGFRFDTWNSFCSSVGEGGKKAAIDKTITRYHAPIPFKQKSSIQSHIAAAINNKTGKFDLLQNRGKVYNIIATNCESTANRLVYGIDVTAQSPVSNRSFNLEEEMNKTDNINRSSGDYESEQVRSAVSYANQIHQVQQINWNGYVTLYPKCKIQ